MFSSDAVGSDVILFVCRVSMDESVKAGRVSLQDESHDVSKTMLQILRKGLMVLANE